jgi:hypothetical protein
MAMLRHKKRGRGERENGKGDKYPHVRVSLDLAFFAKALSKPD